MSVTPFIIIHSMNQWMYTVAHGCICWCSDTHTHTLPKTLFIMSDIHTRTIVYVFTNTALLSNVLIQILFFKTLQQIRYRSQFLWDSCIVFSLRYDLLFISIITYDIRMCMLVCNLFNVMRPWASLVWHVC